MNSSLLSASASAVWRRSSSTIDAIVLRNWVSAIRINRHGCIKPTLGAWCAAARKAFQHDRFNRIKKKMAHVTALGYGTINGSTFGITETMCP